MGKPDAGQPVLIVLGGLPGVGKTTVARLVCARSAAVLLRIDAIEQAIRDAGLGPVGTAGYRVAHALAGTTLRNGFDVVADAVNPVEEARAGWAAVAAAGRATLLTVELFCSDPAEHRRRVACRAGDIPGLLPPDWAAVSARRQSPWTQAALRLDTALVPAETTAAHIRAAALTRRADRS